MFVGRRWAMFKYPATLDPKTGCFMTSTGLRPQIRNQSKEIRKIGVNLLRLEWNYICNSSLLPKIYCNVRYLSVTEWWDSHRVRVVDVVSSFGGKEFRNGEKISQHFFLISGYYLPSLPSFSSTTLQSTLSSSDISFYLSYTPCLLLPPWDWALLPSGLRWPRRPLSPLRGLVTATTLRSSLRYELFLD